MLVLLTRSLDGLPFDTAGQTLYGTKSLTRSAPPGIVFEIIRMLFIIATVGWLWSEDRTANRHPSHVSRLSGPNSVEEEESGPAACSEGHVADSAVVKL